MYSDHDVHVGVKVSKVGAQFHTSPVGCVLSGLTITTSRSSLGWKSLWFQHNQREDGRGVSHDLLGPAEAPTFNIARARATFAHGDAAHAWAFRRRPSHDWFLRALVLSAGGRHIAVRHRCRMLRRRERSLVPPRAPPSIPRPRPPNLGPALRLSASSAPVIQFVLQIRICARFASPLTCNCLSGEEKLGG